MMSYDVIVNFSVDKLGITDLEENIEMCHKQVHMHVLLNVHFTIY